MVIIQQETESQGGEIDGGIIQGEVNQEVMKCINRSWLLMLIEKRSLREMGEITQKMDVRVTNMVKWGSFGIIIICADMMKAERVETRKHSLIGSFVKVGRMSDWVEEYKRYTWLECRGIPAMIWSKKTMENLAAKWGKFLGLSYEIEYVEDIEIAMTMIETSQV